MTRPRVFLTQDDQRFDLSDLDRYGRRLTLFDRSHFADEVDKHLPWMVERARHVFNRYDFDQHADFVALIGDPLNIAVTFFVLGGRGAKQVRTLKFDAREGRYYEATFNLVHRMPLTTPPVA